MSNDLKKITSNLSLQNRWMAANLANFSNSDPALCPFTFPLYTEHYSNENRQCFSKCRCVIWFAEISKRNTKVKEDTWMPGVSFRRKMRSKHHVGYI